jgi:hypothetical protein
VNSFGVSDVADVLGATAILGLDPPRQQASIGLVTGATQRLPPVPKPGVITEPAHRLNERLQSLCTAGASTAPAGLSYAGTARCRTTAAARQVRTAPATWPYARVAQMGTYGEGRPGRQRNGQVVIHVVSITAVVQIGAGVRLGHRRRLSRSTSPSCSVKPLHPTTSTLLTRSSHTCSTQQHYEQIATPLEWKFTKDHLNALLERVAAHHADHTLAAYPDREYVTEISCQTTDVTMTGSMPVNSTAAPATMATNKKCRPPSVSAPELLASGSVLNRLKTPPRRRGRRTAGRYRS